MTDGAFAEGINYLFPGAAFIAADGVRRLMNGLNPGQPKHCGLEIVSGRHMPEEWQGHLLTADYRANRINRFVLSDEGSGYSSRQVSDLISSNHVSFRPVDIRMGPDGAIYVADWYNPIIQHGEVDFRDPRRDHDHGRIWRITAKDRPLVTAPKLAGASVEELLEALKSQEGWTREQARRLLKERGAAEVVPALEAWVEGLAEAEAERELHRLQALWVFPGARRGSRAATGGHPCGARLPGEGCWSAGALGLAGPARPFAATAGGRARGQSAKSEAGGTPRRPQASRRPDCAAGPLRGGRAHGHQS